uniref:SERPIN domain-containing protein n=2 Tax=Loa loa TaxID=7209 RepID=A0A1I7VHN6_LOALO
MPNFASSHSYGPSRTNVQIVEDQRENFYISPVATAQFKFTVSLLKEIAQDGKSAILSPFSISTTLFMVYLAANDETKRQLHNILGGTANEGEIRQHFARMLAVIDSRTNENYTLNIANRFYVQQGFFTREASPEHLDFITEINNWVSEKTRSKITELITADDVNKDIVILLLNAIYFGGIWKTQFDDTVTRNEAFHISECETKNVLMMRLRAKFPYYEDDSVQVVKLPYVGDEVEMVLILPKIRFNIANVLKNMTGEYLLSYVDRAVPDIVLLKLPRFRLEAKLDLKGTLQRIGIRDAFSERANFRELTDDAVFVGGVMHKGFIEVNEKGTESAAATVIDIVPRMLMESKPFIADQPFLFAIVRNSDTILFAGQFAK